MTTVRKLVLNKENEITQLEKEQKELIEISILKQKLLKLFDEYKSSRSGLVTWLFRNSSLTKEKLVIVDEAISFIKSYEGTKQDFLNGLIKRKLDNAEISRQFNKFHYNLLEHREYKYKDQDGDIHTAYKVNAGESSFASGLARLFHEAISIAKNSSVSPNIRNSFKTHS